MQPDAAQLDAMPPRVQDGGLETWIARLRDPAVRARVIAEVAEVARERGVSPEDAAIDLVIQDGRTCKDKASLWTWAP